MSAEMFLDKLLACNLQCLQQYAELQCLHTMTSSQQVQGTVCPKFHELMYVQIHSAHFVLLFTAMRQPGRVQYPVRSRPG